MAPNIWDMLANSTEDAMNKYSQLNFVQRMKNGEKFITNPDGTVSTHLMMNDGNVSYPSIIEDNKGGLITLPMSMAGYHANKTGEYIPFKSNAAADSFSRGDWKQKALMLPEYRYRQEGGK